MRANDQRDIIEQLLGITKLSDKAERLKELVKLTKDSITEEEYRIKAIQDANKKIQEQIESLERRQRLWETKREEDIDKLARALEDLKDIDVEKEIEEHKLLAEYHTKVKRKQDAEKWVKSLRADYAKEEKTHDKLQKEIADLQDHKCFACGSKLHDNKQETILASKLKQKEDSEKHMLKLQSQADEYESVLVEVGDIGRAPKVFYDTIDQAMEHRASIDKLSSQLEHKLSEQDPYIEQIADMRISAIQDVSWDHVNELTRLKEHQDFLLKLLTNKDSFIRKTIIDQNLAYLNARLHYYLQQIGLPHSVKFQSDLTVLIEELGRELDFDNLSRGERNRLILSLSWAFRDVWEGLYQPINLLFIDEMIDSGMDTSGVESAMAILKKMSRERNKSIFLVSHKDELSSRVNNILTVVKENGFTTYSNDIEIKE
jgi:DNA repair exonuclease SbcCD ATPase subunit